MMELRRGRGVSVRPTNVGHGLRQQSDQSVRFVELTADASAHGGGGSDGSAIELVLGGEVTVRVRAGFDAAVLRQVVEALR